MELFTVLQKTLLQLLTIICNISTTKEQWKRVVSIALLYFLFRYLLLYSIHFTGYEELA